MNKDTYSGWAGGEMPQTERNAIADARIDFMQNYRRFTQDNQREVSSLLFCADYDESGKIIYTSPVGRTTIPPLQLSAAFTRSIEPDLSQHPTRIEFTEREPLRTNELALGPRLKALEGEKVLLLNTIYPLMVRNQFLSEVRRVQVKQLDPNNAFHKPQGEFWLASRWIHEDLAADIWQLISRRQDRS